MATGYTNTKTVADLLRNGVRVNIDQAEPSQANSVDMSYAGVDAIRLRVESEMTQRLGRFYSVPLALTDKTTIDMLEAIAVNLTGYRVWLAIHPTTALTDLPAAVKQWQVDAEALLDQIVPKGKTEALDGRDVILSGEVLRTDPGTAGTAPVYFTQTLPVGGVRE